MDTLNAKHQELLKIKRVNYLYVAVAMSLLIFLVIWAFLNNDNDTLGEKIFFISSLYVVANTIYLVVRYVWLPPRPIDINFESLKTYQELIAFRSIKANRHYQLGIIQMYVISMMGIIIMEKSNDSKLWIYCVGVILLGAIYFWRSVWTEGWCRGEYERLTGETFIPLD